ncbi:MAG: OmpH family outer membrane protein [Bacteroidia bacterium]|nr:OmpH family outer membrane protein [Bacteroidia bacterium]
MKKIFALGILLILLGNLTFAQKFGYIDSQSILEKMPAYQAAQQEIDQISAKWQADLEEKYKVIEKKYKDYQAEAVLLPDDVKKSREEEIFALEREAKDYKKEKFGYDGELYKLQDEKIRPIQDQIFESVAKIAESKKLDIILDKSADTGIIYANPLYDRTKDVLNMMGIKE